MLTFSNTIITKKTYLNLNLVQLILFNEPCFEDEHSIDCHVIFLTDDSVRIISLVEEPIYINQVLQPYITWRGDLIRVIRDKELYQNLCDLKITEND